MNTNAYNEWNDSQAPALALLGRLGWHYLSPAQALAARQGSRSRVLLETILEESLHRINRIEFKGEHRFSDENIKRAVEALRDVPDDGLIRTNESVYDLLTLGKSFEQEIDGDRKSYTLQYIDWKELSNNVYHVSDEFEVSGLYEDRRPDIVLFVNGIPLVVIECKRRDKDESIGESISQFIRNQKLETGIPKLFHYSQMLLAVQPNDVLYATVGTEMKFWSMWRESTDLDPQLDPLLTNDNGTSRMATEQDRAIYALCRTDRVMELAYQFTVFDAGEKKIARYQQYFAVKRTLERIRTLDAEARRRGGVIWHTQGSGKSLTMVMLSKAIALDEDIINPRVILVTDRVDLDDQIWKTFRACGKDPKKASTGTNLIDLLAESGNDIIATVLDKFDSALNRREYTNDSENIFVLIDESHRSQYGMMHAKMKKMLPRACYIGFTGTPLMKAEKNTASKLGGIIDVYPIDQAVRDKAVVPLLYEGRDIITTVNRKQIDRGFDRIAEPLSDYNRLTLKQKYANESRLFRMEQVIAEIARDITDHYVSNWQGTGYKAQLAAPDKATAIRYHRSFADEGKLSTAIIISPPDAREGYEDAFEEEATDDVQKFWRAMMNKYGNEERYIESILASFGREDGIEIIIVVDKLLVGFDEPRNTVLYITRTLRDHALLQAIARVNRLFPGKDFGYIIDYRGVLGELDEALQTYSALAEYDAADVASSVTDVMEEVERLPQRRADVWEMFKEVKNKDDNEEMERLLADEELRDRFHQRLSSFARTLQIALSVDRFHEETPTDDIKSYTNDLRHFQHLRASVRLRYAEEVDFKEYEARMRKLLDTHVTVDEVTPITGLVNIFDKEAFRAEVDRLGKTDASKADIIASRTKKTITEHLDEDPVFYRKFSEMLQIAIDDFRQKRIDELQYLNKVTDIYDQVASGAFQGVPESLINRPEARAFYGVISNTMEGKIDGRESGGWRERMTQAGIDIAELVESRKIVDWRNNIDVERAMRSAIEDYLLDMRRELELELPLDEIDLILDQAIHVARSRR
jgi:type I restriction enzyme R subunit